MCPQRARTRPKRFCCRWAEEDKGVRAKLNVEDSGGVFKRGIKGAMVECLVWAF